MADSTDKIFWDEEALAKKNEDPVVKSLKWLQIQFPWIDNPEDNTDKMCNAINTYAKAAEIKINTLEDLLDKKTKECEDLKRKLEIIFNSK